MQSVVSIDSGVKLVYSIKSVLNENGFQLTEFVGNDPTLLCNIQTPDICYEKDNVLVPLTDSKVLGIMWNVSDDYFYFDVNIKKYDVFTRRYILSFISSIFDPLGRISPILVPGKCIFQKTTMLKLAWDTSIPDDLCVLWQNWLDKLLFLSEVRIPRCLKPIFCSNSCLELH